MKIKSNLIDQIVPSISELRALFNGRVIAPDDPRYEQARTVFYGGIDCHPAAIVRVADAGDVSRLVSVAREAGIELAIRSGGHSNAGHSTTEGGIVLDLSAMKDLQINVQDKTAWAEAGLTAGEYVVQTAAYGLTTGFGDTGTVGLGGITLGGGVGYLVRKHGLTIDNLLAAEIVTADAQLLHVDDQNHPDLFWAIRGGGGNFGVATRFKFHLHELDKVLGGMLCLPATADTIASFLKEADSAPNELSTILNIMTAPPMPFLPADMHGKVVIMAMMVYAGDIEMGEQVISKFRSIATPYADMIRPMTYPEMFPPEEGGDYHPVAAGRTMFIDHVTRSEAEMILNRLQSSSASMAVTQLRVLGGAMSRVRADATAFAHRNSRIMVNLAALYENPNEKRIHEAWVTEFASALRQSDNGAYVNFLADVDEAQVRAAYPNGTWERLAAIKARYDPDNFFHLNQNIPPK
ncbi:FAD-binding oxidoreductase [Candidatus Villigracilis saccharophilus]|uniref:FAD-binding oxidoreductase n=1 Tax=Candidatus Villigracilis saccharophilus TaxID=3140684 RepID=UPI003136140D|nr:FAD-binding oxidoreductase [Anaerolineales bacterium]